METDGIARYSTLQPTDCSQIAGYSSSVRKQIQHGLTATFCVTLLFAFAQTVNANPIGGNVMNGSASFATAGNTLTVTNTPGTIINWQGFSINSNEVTKFAQQSAASTVLNRVVGSDPSNIMGTLQSNGRVFLINPNGILFGAGAVVDVAGLMASTLNLSDADFLAGKNHFTAVPGAGNINNAGNISAQQGGQIFLIAPNVENTGVITAPNGEILLAAGYSVDLVSTDDPNLRVNITAPAGNATNVGQLIASSGSLGLFGTVVSNSGIVSADSATMQGGKIVFKASQLAEVGGTVSANGTTGGDVQVLGNQVGIMDGATVTANGEQGGGTILVGGDYQGTNPGVPNAQVTYVAPTANIHADATGNGNGGKVIVWADDTTRFYGNISARGGNNGGNGGFVETSGHNYLDFQGRVNTWAPHGLVGTLLLDPANITIDNSANTWNGTISGGIFSNGNSSAAPSYITWATINAQTGNVQIWTTPGTGGLGDININASGTITGPTTLTLLANNNITFAPGVSVIGTGEIDLISGWNNTGLAVTGGTGTISFGAGSSLSTTGNIVLRAGYAVTEAAGASISANLLDISGDVNGGLKFPGGISLAGPNMVNTLAVDTAITGGGSLTFSNGKALTIGAGIYATGIAAGGNTSAINITTAAGDIAISQNITSAGSVTLTSAGAITQTAAINTLGLLTTSSVGGTTLTLPGANTVGSFSATNAGSGNIAFNNVGALTLNAVSDPVGSVIIQTTGNLTIKNGISSGAIGDAVVLVAGGLYDSGDSSPILTAPAGTSRWLIYSSTPIPVSGTVNFCCVSPDFTQYAATYGQTPVAQSTGNGFLFSLAPTLTVSLTGTLSKVYDGTTAATLTAANYNLGGAMNSQINGAGTDILTLSKAGSGLYNTPNASIGLTVTASGFTVTAVDTNGKPVYGYTYPASVFATGTITPALLTVAANATSKILNTADPALTYTVTGLQTGDTVLSTLNPITISRATGESVGTYPISVFTSLATGVASTNYTLSLIGANFTILVPTVINEIVDTSNSDRKQTGEILASVVPTGEAGNAQSLPMCN